MALSEKTYLKQIELLCDPDSGKLTTIFAEYVNIILKDGKEISNTIHRDSFLIDSEDGKKLLIKASELITNL